jgi:hypothetical protein
MKQAEGEYRLPLDSIKRCNAHKLTLCLRYTTTTVVANQNQEELWVDKDNLYLSAISYTNILKLSPSKVKASEEAYKLLFFICDNKIEPEQAQLMAKMLLNQMKGKLT